MSPPTGQSRPLHPRPNTHLSSESELKLPEFTWVPLLRRITSSSDPPVRFTCLVELSPQTLTGSCCCRGRWARQGAAVNGDRRGKALAECARAEGWSPFLCIISNSGLGVFCLTLPCCLSWLRIEQPCISTVRAERMHPTGHEDVYLFLLGCRGLCVSTLGEF